MKLSKEKIINSRVLIAGLGGLGSACAIYLAAAGIGKIGIVDFDKVEINNLQRQIIHSENYINKQKVESATDRIKKLNSEIEVVAYDTKLTPKNALNIMSDYDIIADCTDN